MSGKMAARPLLSIVVPSFNAGKYIARCISSIMVQGVESGDYEIIVVDNLSTDETKDVLANYGAQHIRVISERDKGQSDALNKGFAAASGQWLCWLNADDELIPGSLPKVISVLQDAKAAAWMGGGMVWMDREGVVIRCAPYLRSNFVLRAVGVANVGGPSSFFRRSLLDRAGPFSIHCHYCMDTDMWHRFQRLGERCRSIDAYVWAFRVHEDSKTSHVVMSDTRSPRMTAELERMTCEYMSPLAKRIQRFVPFIWRAYAISTLRDWKAFRDTRRFRGQHVSTMDAAKC